MSVIARRTFNGIQIPFFKHSEEIYIQAITVAKALGYVNPKEAVRNIINRHIDEFRRLIFIPKLGMENSSVLEPANLAVSVANASKVFLHERAVYKFCMFARTEKAKRFREWVTRIIQQYRRESNELVNADPLDIIERLNQINTLTLQKLREQEQKLLALEEKTSIQERKIAFLEEVNRTTYIDRHQGREITKRVGQVAYALVEVGLEQNLKSAFKKVYSRLYEKFQVSSYKDIPKIQFSETISFLEDWFNSLKED